jgi:hypothetical protein
MHEPRHAFAAPHTYGTHAVVVGVPQFPAPSQYATDVDAPALHAEGRHEVLMPGGVPHAMRFDPSHVAWQTPLPGHTLRDPCGAPATAVH